MQTDVCNRIINEKMNKKNLTAGFSVIHTINAFNFSKKIQIANYNGFVAIAIFYQY